MTGTMKPREEAELTDIYGRRIKARTDDSNLDRPRHLHDTLDISKQRETKDKDEQEILTYAETLHKGLKTMWIPMVYLGRMPFRLILKNNRASIVVRRRSPVYVYCFIMCALTWLLFLWITLGILFLLAKRPPLKSAFAKIYWSDMFIFWTTLLQACISHTHIIYQAGDFALFIKAWYSALDITKIEVSKTLKRYIISSQITLFIFLIAMIIMFSLPNMFDGLQGTTWLIIIVLKEPLVFFEEKKSEEEQLKEIESVQKLAGVGLLLYLIAIIFSWMYIMQFMVFCRCFRIGLKCINERIAMILNVDDVQRVGPNALRLTYENIHKDYLGIATTGMKIGRIFSWTVCNYYLWAILVLVVELGNVFLFAKYDYRKQSPEKISAIKLLEKTMKYIIPIPVQRLTNEMLHLLVTTFCIFYVSYEGSGACKEGKASYELARYRGLVECTTQLERNFIRSIWIIVSEKCPVLVAPGNFFGITHSTTMTVFATAVTYFIFWAQSQRNFEAAVER